MKKFKKFFLFVITLLLMFSLVILQFSIFVRFRLFNENFYETTLAKNNYYKYLNEDINTNFKTLSSLSAIPEEVFKESISEELIKTETNNNIKNAINFMTSEKEVANNGINMTQIEKNLLENIKTYAKNNNIQITTDVEKQIKTVSTDTSKLLNSHVNLFNIDQVKKINEFLKLKKILSIFYNYITLFSIIILVLIVIIMILNKKAPWRNLLWVGSGLISSGALILLPGLLGFVFKVPYRLAIEVSYIKEALTRFLERYFYFSIYSGFIAMILGIFMLSIYFNISIKHRVREKH